MKNASARLPKLGKNVKFSILSLLLLTNIVHICYYIMYKDNFKEKSVWNVSAVKLVP